MCGHVPRFPPVGAQLGYSGHGCHWFGQLPGHMHGQGFLRWVRVIDVGEVDENLGEDGLVELFTLLALSLAAICRDLS